MSPDLHTNIPGHLITTLHIKIFGAQSEDGCTRGAENCCCYKLVNVIIIYLIYNFLEFAIIYIYVFY